MQEPDVRHGKGNRAGLAERGLYGGMWSRHMKQTGNLSPTKIKPSARPRLLQPQFCQRLPVTPLEGMGKRCVRINHLLGELA